MNGLYKENTENYFAAANTCGGFKSFFEDIFTKNNCEKIYILKGGPGCGKSTFIKKARIKAIESGYSCECFFCSSDPDSFDGIIIKELKTAIVDGTFPHILEPSLAGAAEIIVNLGKGWDTDALFYEKEKLYEISQKKKQCYTDCYRLLSCKKITDNCIFNLTKPYIREDKLTECSKRLVNSLFKGSKNKTKCIQTRITNAISCKGKIRLSTFEDMANYCIFIKPPFEGCCIPFLFMENVLRQSENIGADVVISKNPESPEFTDALYFPEIGVSLSIYNEKLVADCDRIFKKCRIINCCRFVDMKGLSSARPLRRFYSSLSKELFEKALFSLSNAGKYHAELEEIYGKHTDYNIIEEITKEYLDNIFIRKKPRQ